MTLTDGSDPCAFTRERLVWSVAPAYGPVWPTHTAPQAAAARRRSRSPDHRYLAGLSPVPAASRCTG